MKVGDFAILKQDIVTPDGRCPAGTPVKLLSIGSVNAVSDDDSDPQEEEDFDTGHYATVQPEDSQSHFDVMLADLEASSPQENATIGET